ncbi:hypothetical protein, partial [Enterococcus faecalis]|uniref:hypothetical protein n=1 Tax=Enterococcus faecalis TaxID=1351 RepID=UPI001C8B46F7
FGYLMFDERSPFAMMAVNDGRRESAIYIAPLSDIVAGRAQWKLAGDFNEQIEQGGLRGDKAWLVSTKDDPNGRLMITDAAKPDLTRARIINLPGNPVINGLGNSKQGAWLQTVEGRSSGLWQVRDDGTARQVKLPFTGTASVLSTNRDDGSAFV